MGLLDRFGFNKESKTDANAGVQKTSEKPVKADVRTSETKSAKKDDAPVKGAATSKPKVWHITKRAEDGKWQIKAEGAKKATKLFNTKAEAEEYIKTLKANNEGSRVVSHKKDGKYQKK